YEGTTAIQAQDFFFRKIARDRGVALRHLLDQVRATARSDKDGGSLKPEKVLLGCAVEDVEEMAATLTTHLLAATEQPTRLYQIGLNAVRFLLAVGDLLVAWRLISAAEIALAAVDSANDSEFYAGKIAVARFFAATVLPHVTAERAVISASDPHAMELAETAF
ncbi:acyl-CoA dehydrogenase C-terminal domain-containing protein, partial [Nocardia neocaledoniensis]